MANDPHLGILRSQRLADRRPALALLSRGRADGAGAADLRYRPQPAHRLGRYEHARSLERPLRCQSTCRASDIVERRESIGVRWWFDSDVSVRETEWGPIVTDVPLLADFDLPPLALKWTGHDASDEIGAMLAVSRARTFDEFRAAFDGFAVPGQNMLYADADGNIGRVLAVRLPAPQRPARRHRPRHGRPRRLVGRHAHRCGLALQLQPGNSGYLVSANDRPPATSIPDRILLLARRPGQPHARPHRGRIRRRRRDAQGGAAGRLHGVVRGAARSLHFAKLDALGMAAAADAKGKEAIGRLRDWDGEYRADSRGRRGRSSSSATASPPASTPCSMERTTGRHSLRSTVAQRCWARRSPLPMRRRCARPLARDSEAAVDGLESFADWSEMHRLSLAHPLSYVPLIGGRYEFAEAGVGGSSATLMKTAHDSTAERHTVDYGSNARHISDMTDPDENYFVLLGGQDGWFNSTTILDQWELWRRGDYVRVPLTLDGGARELSARALAGELTQGGGTPATGPCTTRPGCCGSMPADGCASLKRWSREQAQRRVLSSLIQRATPHEIREGPRVFHRLVPRRLPRARADARLRRLLGGLLAARPSRA